MSPIWSWIVWAVMLAGQSASTTWASRARNSSSIGYHAIASTFSNGVWFLNFAIGINKLVGINGVWRIAGVALFYTAFTVAGAAFMHWLSMHHLERGNRKVGA